MTPDENNYTSNPELDELRQAIDFFKDAHNLGGLDENQLQSIIDNVNYLESKYPHRTSEEDKLYRSLCQNYLGILKEEDLSKFAEYNRENTVICYDVSEYTSSKTKEKTYSIDFRMKPIVERYRERVSNLERYISSGVLTQDEYNTISESVESYIKKNLDDVIASMAEVKAINKRKFLIYGVIAIIAIVLYKIVF